MLFAASPNQRVNLCQNLCDLCLEHFGECGYVVVGDEDGGVDMCRSGGEKRESLLASTYHQRLNTSVTKLAPLAADSGFDFIVKAVETLHAALSSDLPDYFRLVSERDLNRMILSLFCLMSPRPDAAIGFLEVLAALDPMAKWFTVFSCRFIPSQLVHFMARSGAMVP